MPLLRLTQHAESQPDAYLVEVALEGDGLARRTASVRFSFHLGPQDHEDLRWYLEDYLQHSADPAPSIAARVEQRMADIGDELFRAVFHADDDAREIWSAARDRLAETRVEIVGEVRQDGAIPWELIRDPRTGALLAIGASAFVRGHPSPAQGSRLPAAASENERIRILLVICRPSGRADVPFRSVASRLIQGLREDDRRLFELEVLRPPTYDALASALRRAKAAGRPYHVVHFDGHGVWADALEIEKIEELLEGLSPHFLGGSRKGRHGYLVFEHSGQEDNASLVDGPTLGRLLAETAVPVLVLNACRSAHAEPPNEPAAAASDGDRHALVRSFGSLAREVMDAGAAGVVAMRYNVYVATAAQFVADLYAALGEGAALGEAVSRGRKQLHARPERSITGDVRPLQDWPVPVVYEAASVTLFPPRPGERHVELAIGAAASAEDTRFYDLPRRPDVGFFGRDETLLAIDRSFDTHPVVLMHAYAGSGKTTAAAEFARWYALTGGVKGPVLFTSFAQKTTLTRALEVLAQAFEADLRRLGIDWLAKSKAERRAIALDLLRQVPVLWIWDNVEPIAGFPAGTTSAWNAAEQAELADFLRDARETKAKFLLTSRRDERAWLGELPRRIEVPPMPMIERVQFAQALGAGYGKKLDVEAYRPLLRFTQGNPLTVLVVVRQALRDGLAKKEQVEAFVAKLRAGEKAFEDEAGGGRSRSLGASLAYGFEHAFSEEERRQVALLHLFQGFVYTDALRVMGEPEREWCLEEIQGMAREAWSLLLDRAAEVGVLSGVGGGYYAIHPAVPWFLKGLFDGFYSASGDESGHLRPVRAYVEAMGALTSSYLIDAYNEGRLDVVATLKAEEANLLHAKRLARIHGWWDGVIYAMQGLRALYYHTSRNAEWAQLVEELVPDLVDPATDGPLPGREKEWSHFTSYRVDVTRTARHWPEAERLQRFVVEWWRKQAAVALNLPLKALDADQRDRIRSLAVGAHDLGQIQREQSDPACITSYEEAIDLFRRIGCRTDEAGVAYNLAHSYKDLPSLRNLDEAERWYQRSLDMCDEDQRDLRAKCLGGLGNVALEHFQEAEAARRPKEELERFLNQALSRHLEAFKLLPDDTVRGLALTHQGFGTIYGAAGDIPRARKHYGEAIRYLEQIDDLHEAARTRRNLATDLANNGRLEDARLYWQAALQNLERYGEGAAPLRQDIQRLLAQLEHMLAGGGGEGFQP
jgi:tetratricopeptide (TPR) repeat protein